MCTFSFTIGDIGIIRIKTLVEDFATICPRSLDPFYKTA